jgi:hypothetical protein
MPAKKTEINNKKTVGRSMGLINKKKEGRPTIAEPWGH